MGQVQCLLTEIQKVTIEDKVPHIQELEFYFLQVSQKFVGFFFYVHF